MRQHIKSNLDLALVLINSSKVLEATSPDGGYYLFMAVPTWQGDEEDLVLHLLEYGVLVHPGFFYNYAGAEDSGDNNPPHIMISALTTPEQLRAGLEKIITALT